MMLMISNLFMFTFVNWLTCQVLRWIKDMSLGTCHVISVALATLLHLKLESKNATWWKIRHIITVNSEIRKDVHWKKTPILKIYKVHFISDIPISNVVQCHHSHVMKHYILHVSSYVKIYHVPWENSYIASKRSLWWQLGKAVSFTSISVKFIWHETSKHCCRKNALFDNGENWSHCHASRSGFG